MKASAICGALVAGSAALLSLGVLPILLGGLVEAGRLSQAGVGRAATLETLGLALGAGVGAHWMGRGSMRLKTASAAFALAAVNVATAHTASSAAVLLDRAAAGLLAGLLLGAANAIIVRTQTPHRLSGAMLGLSTLPQILAAYLLPVVVVPRFGVTAGFYLLAAGVLLAALCAWTMVDAVEPLERPRHNTARTSLPLLLFAGAVVLQSGGIGAAWTYVERLAHQQGFSPSTVGAAVAGGLACQLSGAWLSAWLSPRAPKWPSLLTLILLQTGFMALAVTTRAPAAFIASVCVLTGAPAAMQPFQVAEIIALDPTRRAALLVGPMILVGNSFGPLAASFAMTDSDVVTGFWTAILMTAAAAGLYAIAAARTSFRIRRAA